MRLAIEEQAQQEARQHVAWYAARNQKAADRLAELFVVTMERIARNPLQFSLMELEDNPGDIRRARLDDFPIVIVFQVLIDEVLVVAVAHTSRRPAYWRGRLRPR